MIGIRLLNDDDITQTLDINASAAPAVATLDRAELTRLMAISDRHLAAANETDLFGYALLFRESDAYDGQEFEMLRSLLGQAPFLYIDQVAIRKERQGSGIGRRLYETIARNALVSGVEWLCCEVNTFPPNPGSAAFHERMGFGCARGLRTGDGREVNLLTRRIDGAH